MQSWWVLVFGFAVALVLQSTVEAAHVIPLFKRKRSVAEERELLNLLQVDESARNHEEDDDEDNKQAAAKPFLGSAPSLQLNSNFFGNIQIGDSKQEFEVVFDTGSSVLWVYSEDCESCKTYSRRPKNTFAKKTSHTFKQRDIPFAIRYGTGESRGTTGVDNIYVADLEVRDQAFGQCEQPDDVMRNFPFDGIVGLSRSLVRDPNSMPTILSNIKQEELLEKQNLANTFSFYIGREENDPTYLIFGGSHEMLEDEKIMHWTSTLNKNIYWEIPLDDIFIHHKQPVSNKTMPHHKYLEQHPRITTHSDSFAAMRADPELALLELESELGKHHPKPNTKHTATKTKNTHTHHNVKDNEEHQVRQFGRRRKQTENNEKAETKNEKATSPSHARLSPEADNADDQIGSGQLMSHFRKPGTSMQPCKQDDLHMCIVSVDSGHSLMSGPPDILRPMLEQLTPKDTTHGCTPSAMEGLPDLSFEIGGKLFTMTPTDYLIELDGNCVPALSERNTRNGHDWVLGEHFMRTFYTVFDYDNQRVGFTHLDEVQPHLPKVMRTK